MKKHNTLSRIFFFVVLLLSALVFSEFRVAVAKNVDDGIFLIAKAKKKITTRRVRRRLKIATKTQRTL